MLHRSFSLVDYKVAEAEFFLQKLGDCGFNFFELKCFVGAFVASARSITFSLQAVLADAAGFVDWYADRQGQLRADPTARFFHEFRTVNQHIGDNLVGGGASGPGRPVEYWFRPSPEVSVVPAEDVVKACTTYFQTILMIIFDCYVAFGPLIDAHQRYTAEYFASIGKSIEDAEEEIGMPRGWTDIGDPHSIPYRWQLLRDQTPGCEINQIFEKYLGRVTPSPERLPAYSP
jgi:hypothetical protein